MKHPRTLGTLIFSIFAIAGARAADGDTPAEPAAPTGEATTAEAPVADVSADLKAAAQKLAAAGNYTWTQTMAFGDREPRTTGGKKGGGGHVMLTMPGRDGDLELLLREGRAAVKRDGTWEKVAEGEGQGRGQFMFRMIENFEEPTAAAVELVNKLSDFKKDDDGTYQATLDEETARELMRFGGRRGGPPGGGGGAPPIAGAGGIARFTVSDGMLTGYKLVLTGRMNFNGQDRDFGRTTTIAFENVGSTSFDIPEMAAGLLAN